MHDLLERLCIRVPKVYDWVNRQIDLPLMGYTGKGGLATLSFDCDGVSGTVEDPCLTLGGDIISTRCFLSDATGNPVDPLTPGAVQVTEIIQPDGRLAVTSTLPNGEMVTLHKVKVLVKGFFVVEVSDLQGNICLSDPQPFATAQTFFLCAPEGTSLNGHVTFFECDANLVCSSTTGTFQQLDVSLTFCLDVHMEASVKVEIEGLYCGPRQELPINVCSMRKIPPQCPEVFPGRDFDC